MSKTEKDNDIAFIRALAAILQENSLREVEVERENGDDNALRIRLSRTSEPSMQEIMPAEHASDTSSIGLVENQAKVSPLGDDPALHPGAVTSPMVGTIYLQPEPGAPAFVSLGSKVKEGSTLLIIEAMKTMNQIPSPRAGIIKRILVEDGGAVEFGTPLVIIE